MRILHLAKYYWPRSGGMERVVQNLAEGAAALGHQVEVVAIETQGARDGAKGGTRVQRSFSVGALGSQEIAPGYLTSVLKGADIVHVHHPHVLADLAVLFRPGRAPVVVTHHADQGRGFLRPVVRTVLHLSLIHI